MIRRFIRRLTADLKQTAFAFVSWTVLAVAIYVLASFLWHSTEHTNPSQCASPCDCTQSVDRPCR
jgi:hypothetical protein